LRIGLNNFLFAFYWVLGFHDLGQGFGKLT